MMNKKPSSTKSTSNQSPPKKAKSGFPSGSGFPKGSIGDVSARIGYDVRDILMAGYSHGDIAELEMGLITAEELRKRGPEKK